MAGQEVAYLTAIVGADVTSFRRGMSEVRQSLLDVGGLSQSLRNVGRNLTLGLSVPIAIAGAATVDAAADFEAAMRNIASISDIVAGDFENSSAIVLDWGGSIRSGPVAAAEALNTVLQAGFGLNDFNEALLVAQVSAFTAEAGLADLTTTTEALVAALLSYSAGADEAQRYSDILTRMVQVGVGSMSEFGNSLAQVLPSAATLGVEFDTLGGVMAYLTQRGFPASRAATSLGNAFNKLITPSEEMSRVWEELGVTSGKDLIQTFGGVQGAFNELFRLADSSPDAARALAAMFPDERGRRAIQLAMADVDAFNATMNEFMEDVTGATARAHNEQMKSFSAQFDLLKSAVSELAITIGQHFLPVITPMVMTLTQIVQGLTELNPEVVQLGLVTAGAVAAVGPLVWVLGTLLTPAGLVAGAITAIVGGLATGVINFDNIRNAINEAMPSFESVERILSLISDAIFTESFVPEIEPPVLPGQDAIWADAFRPTTLFERITSAVTTFGPMLEVSVRSMIDQGFGWIRYEGIPKLQENIAAAIGRAVSWVENEGFPKLDSLASSLLDELTFAFIPIASTGEGDAVVYNALRDLFNGGIEDALSGVGGWFKKHFPKLSASMEDFFSTFESWLLLEGVPTLGRIIGFAFGKVSILLTDTIKSIFSGVGKENPFVTAFRTGIEAGWADAMTDANVQLGIEELKTKVVGAIALAFVGLKLLGVGNAIGMSITASILKFSFTKILSPVGLAIVNAVATATLGAAVKFTSWGAVISALFGGLVTSITSFVSAGAATVLKGIGAAFTKLITLAWSGIKWLNVFVATSVSPVVAAISAALAGALVGFSLYNAIPEETRTQIANDFWDWFSGAILGSEESYTDLQNRIGQIITDPLARIADVLVGPEGHNLWQLNESYAQAVEAIDYSRPFDAPLNNLIHNLQAPINTLAGIWDAKDGKGLGAIAGSLALVAVQVQGNLMTIRDNMVKGLDGTWLYAGPEFRKLGGNMERVMSDNFESTKAAVSIGKGKINTEFSDLINKTKINVNTLDLALKYMVSAFNIQSVKLPTDPFVNALINLRKAIQPIIDGIIAAWNAMLALIGQEVIVPTPTPTPTPTPVTPTPPRPPRGGGPKVPTFATPGFLGAGQWGVVGDTGPELVRFGRPSALMPKSMYGGETSGMIQNNNITIVTNNPDKLLEELRRRGIDLKKRA